MHGIFDAGRNESVAKIIHNARKPVLTIKPCAAGRTTPYVGLNFTYNTIREQDLVCIGCFTPEEALKKSTEPWFVEHVYAKLIKKAAYTI